MMSALRSFGEALRKPVENPICDFSGKSGRTR